MTNVEEGLNKKDILQKLSILFKCIEKEAIMHTVIECMYRNKISIGEELFLEMLVETIGELQKEKKIHFMLIAFTKNCFDELIPMRDENFLLLGEKELKGKELICSLTIIPGTELAKIIEEFI